METTRHLSPPMIATISIDKINQNADRHHETKTIRRRYTTIRMVTRQPSPTADIV